MRFISTRDITVDADGASAVAGLPTAGVYVPKEIPELKFAELIPLDYSARCERVLKAFFGFDLGGVTEAYEAFEDVAPTVKLDDNVFVSELWHGKAHTFEDMALSALPGLIDRAKKNNGDTKKTVCFAALSGDGAVSAIEGFKDGGIECAAFYPQSVPVLQRTLLAKSENAIAVAASPYDAKNAVASAVYDKGLTEALAENNISLCPTDEANFAVVALQIAYYYSAYCDLVDADEIKPGEGVDFVLPVGFGNVVAGYYAKRMGLPINKLVCASSGSLADFIESGTFDVNGDNAQSAALAISPVDIERLVFEISGRNCSMTAERMKELALYGRFSVGEDESDLIKDLFAGENIDDGEVRDAIADGDDEYGYIMDPHTAAAYALAARREFVHPTVIFSVANPFLYADTVLRALGERAEAGEKTLKKLEEISAIDAPKELIEAYSGALKQKQQRIIAQNEIISYLVNRYGNGTK